jgi:hypothetical protein
LQNAMGALKTELKAEISDMEAKIGDKLGRLTSRLEDLERTDRVVCLAPRMPELGRHTHRAVRANSVSGPRYR